MRTRWVHSLAAVLLGSNLAWGQAVPPPEAPPGPSPVPVYPGPPAVSDYNPTSPAGGPYVPPPPPPGPAPGCGQPVWAEPAPSQRERVWADAEYLLWWLSAPRLPAVVGAVPASQLGMGELPPGAITHLFSGDDSNFHAFSGARFTGGVWLDEEQYIGLEGSFFGLEERNRHFSAASTPGTVVGPLFADVTSGRETIITPTQPNQATESVAVHLGERLWGAEGNFRTRAAVFANSPIDLIAGFRYLGFTDTLDTLSTTNFIGDGTRSYADHFDTRNQFYGGQVGAVLDLRECRWSFKIAGKIALGGMQESFNIRGATLENFGTPAAFPGGILALPPNSGHFTHSQFAWVPELTLNLGYNVTRFLRCTVGYNFLYLSDVMRAGDEIDAVNPRYIQGLIVNNPSNVARPVPTFRSSDLYAHGLTFGVEVLW